jgi:hypothetical protein
MGSLLHLEDGWISRCRSIHFKQEARPRSANVGRIIDAMTAARLLILTLLAAVIVFAVVQDRLTAAAARQYVTLQRAAAAGTGPPVTIDEVMRPGVRRSVRVALLWSGTVALAGLVGAAAVARRRRV